MQEREIRKSVEAIMNRCEVVIAIPSIIDQDGGTVVEAFLQFDRKRRISMKEQNKPLRVFQQYDKGVKVFIYAETYKLKNHSYYMKEFLKMCKSAGNVRIIGMEFVA